MSNDARWFRERPPRVGGCSICRGSGFIERPYYLAPADYVYDSPNGAIRAMVVGSGTIFEACVEASDIATRAREPVAFRFLDHTVVVAPESEPEAEARDWWLKQYGETVEQSWARR